MFVGMFDNGMVEPMRQPDRWKEIMSEQTDDDVRKEELAADAAERIKRGQHWNDWMLIADGLMVGRRKAMFAAGTNAPKGKGYGKAMKTWMDERPWARDLDNPTRNDLFWCVEHRSEIEIWRDTLAQNERARLNHPSAMKRRYEASHKSKDDGDKPPRRSPTAMKDARIEALEEELATLKKENVALKSHGQGSLFDLHKDTAADIAETTFRHVGLGRTRGIRDALTKLVKREEDALRKTSKPAG
jgi:hypothetical protein